MSIVSRNQPNAAAIRIIRDAKKLMYSNLPSEHKCMAIQAWRSKADQYLKEQM